MGSRLFMVHGKGLMVGLWKMIDYNMDIVTFKAIKTLRMRYVNNMLASY